MTRMRQVVSSKGYSHEQFWLNHKDGIVYETMGQPDHGFTAEIGATPIYNARIGANNMKVIHDASLNGTLTQSMVDALPDPSIDLDLRADMEEYDSFLGQRRIKEAALLSTDNPAVNVVRIDSQLYGLKDRAYSGMEMFRAVATEELILNFDKVLKMEGLEEIPENTLPRIKNISYERVNLQTRKYGLMIRVSDEAIRKNVHNPFQDSVTVAGTKVMQRKSFDVITECDTALDTITADGLWNAFVSGTDRSEVDPTVQITALVTQLIEGTNVGGKWDRMGIHQIGGKIYDTNSFLRGIVEPVSTAELAPGTRPLRGFSGVTMVNDQFMVQGKAYFTDSATEATGILLEGPTRIATKVDELLGTQNYAILDHHLAQIINPTTGFQLNTAYTPISPS